VTGFRKKAQSKASALFLFVLGDLPEKPFNRKERKEHKDLNREIREIREIFCENGYRLQVTGSIHESLLSLAQTSCALAKAS
jgi:hypothetical protein